MASLQLPPEVAGIPPRLSGQPLWAQLPEPGVGVLGTQGHRESREEPQNRVPRGPEWNPARGFNIAGFSDIQHFSGGFAELLGGGEGGR